MKPTPEKLKIAMLGHKRIPSNEGGVEVVVEALCARMAALGHSVTCYNRAGHHVSGAEHELPAGSVYRGIRLVTVPTLERKGFAAVISSFFAAARIYIDQALANDSDSVQSGVVFEHAGDIYFRNGLTDEAVGYWQRAVKAGGGSELLPKKIKYRKIIEDGDRKKQEMVHQMSSEIMRVESITEDNMESSCSMIRKYSYKRSEFLRFNLYLCHVISEFCLFSFRNTKIGEKSDMAKS